MGAESSPESPTNLAPDLGLGERPSTPAGDERVEVIDDQGRVTGVVTRTEMRQRALGHRCTYIFVLQDFPEGGQTSTQLVVHRRADWKDIYPGYWDVAFGGVCGVGESWVESASRELAEEAGISGLDLIDLGESRYYEGSALILGRIFVACWNGPLDVDDGDAGEVAEVTRVPTETLASWVAGRLVCPDSRAALLKVTAWLSQG